MADKVRDDVPLLPFEKGGSPEKSPEESLFDALASDPDFAEDTTEDHDEPVAVEDDEEEDDGPTATPTDDEDDESDVDESDEDESDEDEEGDASATVELDDSVEIEIDGERVTLGELKKGNLRQADYTRKTQALAEERRALEAEKAQTAEARTRYIEGLTQLEQAIKPLIAEPDWEQLRKENPAEYAAQWADYQQAQKDLEAIQRERQRAIEAQQAEQAAAYQAFVEQERQRLVEAIPEWQDEAVARQEKAALRDFAHSLGYTDEELAQVVDHRVMLILRDAKRYRDLTTEGKREVEKKVKKAKVLPPGAAKGKTRNSSKVKRLERARNRLAKSGRVDDAQAVILELLGEDD